VHGFVKEEALETRRAEVGALGGHKDRVHEREGGHHAEVERDADAAIAQRSIEVGVRNVGHRYEAYSVECQRGELGREARGDRRLERTALAVKKRVSRRRPRRALSREELELRGVKHSGASSPIRRKIRGWGQTLRMAP